MEKKKFSLKNIIWLINGLILLLICLFAVYSILEQKYCRNQDYHGGIIVGEEKKKAKEQNLELQTIKYSKPSSMLNTDYKCVIIDQADYKIPRHVMEIARCANDFKYGVTINAIIFNEEKKDYKLILNKIACIKRIDAPFTKYDSLQTIIVYNIAFNDSNNDGLINNMDFGEIHISDLDGSNFQKIAPDSLTTIDYDFTPDFKGIYLQCLKVNKDSSVPREHWLQFSAYYDVDSRKFQVNSKLNSLVEKSRQILIN